MWAALYTENELDIKDVSEECVSNKWAPIVSLRQKATDPPTIPLFYEERLVRKFINQYLPTEWMHGGVDLTEKEINWMQQKGWVLKPMDYLHKIDRYQTS